MTDTITVKNESGQVASFLVAGPNDPRVAILEQRIARGELVKAGKGEKSVSASRFSILDSDAGLADERGDLLKSVHGGGLDPDADGDVLGQPSGSKAVDGAVVVDGVSDAAIAQAEARPQSEPAKKAAAAKSASK